MSRPLKHPDEGPLDQEQHLYLTATLARRMARAAKKAGLSVTDWIRNVLAWACEDSEAEEE